MLGGEYNGYLLNYRYNATPGTNRKAGGPGCRREAIPTLVMVPAPQNATGLAAGLATGAPGGRENRRGGTRRGISGAEGGIDDFDIFPRLQPPPDGGGAVSRDDRIPSTHQGVDPGQWIRGGGGFVGDEYELSIYFLIMITTSTIFASYHTLLSK